MICPNCKTEYIDGITKCADCHIELVDCLPEEEIFVCDNCNNEIAQDDTWCPHCGVLFDTTKIECTAHKLQAIGKCLICETPVCERDSAVVKNKLFCKEHKNYDFLDNGWVRIYETGHDWDAELVKQDLENNNILAVVDNHKDHTRQFTVGHLSTIYVLVPFESVLDAEKLLKKNN